MGNQSSQSLFVTLDTQPPVVVIQNPVTGSATQAATITVSGTVTDPGTNASRVAQVRINGTPATLNAGTWTLSGVALAEGQNSLVGLATDNTGNEPTVTVTGLRDLQPHVITVTSPTSNAVTVTPASTSPAPLLTREPCFRV